MIVLAASNVSCDFDDLDMCGYRDLSKAGTNWVQSRNSLPPPLTRKYLRTTLAHIQDNTGNSCWRKPVPDFITGNAVALHCCMAYAKINRKWEIRPL